MTTLATLVVKVVGDIKEYSSAIKQSQEITDTFSGRAVNGLSMIGGSLVVGALSTGAAAVAGLGMSSWTAGEQIDEAMDIIQIGTGAVGDALDGLRGTFNNVFSSIPTDANLAATAISGLNTRLGMTGPMLETSSIQLLEMSRLLGGDVQANAGLFARVMGDWAVPLKDNGLLLDKVFVASQATGVGVEKLMSNLVQFGAPMRNMNFEIDEAIALFAKWEKEGVNAELVMGSLRIAAGQFASANIPLRDGLNQTFDSIKNATSESEALSIAMGVFGARAAGDMSVAIREGRFDIEDLVNVLGNAEGAIVKTSDATADWPEHWRTIGNTMTVQLDPIGDVLRAIAGEAMEMLSAFISTPESQEFIANLSLRVQDFGGLVLEWMPRIAQGMRDGLGWLDENRGVVVAALAMIGTALLAFAYTSLAAAIPALIGFVVAAWPVILILGLVGATAYLMYAAWVNNWGDIQGKTQAAIDFVRGVIDGGMQFISDLTSGKLGWISEYWNNMTSGIMLIVNTWVTNVTLIFQAFQAAMNGDWYRFGELLREAWDNTWDMLGKIVELGWENIKLLVGNMITGVVNFFNDTDWGAVGRGIVEGIAKGLTASASLIASAATNAAKAALDAAKGFLGIQSPSRRAEDEVGLPTGEGAARGTARGWLSGMADLLPKTMPALQASLQSGGGSAGQISAVRASGGVRVERFELVVGAEADEFELARRLSAAFDVLIREKGYA